MCGCFHKMRCFVVYPSTALALKLQKLGLEVVPPPQVCWFQPCWGGEDSALIHHGLDVQGQGGLEAMLVGLGFPVSGPATPSSRS